MARPKPPLYVKEEVAHLNMKKKVRTLKNVELQIQYIEHQLHDVETSINHTRYEINSIFYENNWEILHIIFESNNIGKKEERAIVVSDLVLGDNNDKSEEHEPSMEEDKGCKEGELQSVIVVSLQIEVCKNDRGKL